MSLAQKDQLLEIGSRARLGKPIICKGLSVPCDKSRDLSAHEVRTNLLFTMSNRTSGEPRSSPQTFIRMTFFTTSLLNTSARSAGSSRTATIPSGLREWWSRTGSNRRHPACKAGALPAELRPLISRSRTMVSRLKRRSPKGSRKWWAWEDLNLRPHAYQARALTN
jgi:hypothetical protein